MRLFRLFRPKCYLLPFGTPRRHTQAWVSPPPQPVASWPHHHHFWLSTSKRSAGRYLERFSSVSRALLRAFLAVLGHVSSDFSAVALHLAHPSPPFVAPMLLLRSIVHEFKLHVIGGVLTRWVSQAMGYGRSMLGSMFLKKISYSRRNCTAAGQKGSKMAQAR